MQARQTFDVEVIDVVRHRNGRVVDLFLRTPDGLEFEPSAGVGIPASLSRDVLSKLTASLKGNEGERLLKPHDGFSGPDYAAPSDALLQCLLSKSIKEVIERGNSGASHQVFQQRSACLKKVLDDKNLQESLKANYSVFDLLDLFPGILSPMDIVKHQPKEHGNKTYTVDGRSFVQRKGVKCFRINVTQDDGVTYRGLFGEQQPNGAKIGQASSYLRSLEVGDTLTVNRGIKPGPQIPRFKKSDRAILLIAQGNATIRMLSLLEDIKIRKAEGKVFGPVLLIGSFKRQAEILELEELRPYLDDGTLSELHLCLSREQDPQVSSHDLITFHAGFRVQHLFDTCPFSSLDRPFVLLAGGPHFYQGSGSVGQFLADRFGYDLGAITLGKQTHDDMRVSSSPNRRHELQGVPYQTGHLSLTHQGLTDSHSLQVEQATRSSMAG